MPQNVKVLGNPFIFGYRSCTYAHIHVLLYMRGMPAKPVMQGLDLLKCHDQRSNPCFYCMISYRKPPEALESVIWRSRRPLEHFWPLVAVRGR